MPSNFTLTLDTTAPVVTFGSWSGQIGGSPLAVSYTINEPAVISATLIDHDNVEWSMAVEPTRLTLLLSNTVAVGPATVEVLVRDSVSNEATYQFPVSVVHAFSVRYTTKARHPIKLRTDTEDKLTIGEVSTAVMKIRSRPIHRIKLHTEAVD